MFNGQPATSPSILNSGSNDALRQAQGLSLSKAAELGCLVTFALFAAYQISLKS